MPAIGTTALHLRIAEFKFTHNFIICDKLPETELFFGINIQRKISLSYAWDKERNCYIQREGKFLVYTNTCDQKATIDTVKPMLWIPPPHSGAVPIKIIEEHMAYFITDDNTSKGKDPNINIMTGIHKIKGRTPVNISVSNYTNKHLTFHKGEYIGHLEPAVMDDTTIEQRESHQTTSVNLTKIMAETVTSDILNPSHHELSNTIQHELNTLLKECGCQFAKDKTSIGTTPLTSMMIDIGASNPISKKPYPIAMKHYQWVREEIEKLLAAKVIHSSRSSWSTPIIVVLKGDGGKHLVID